MTTYEYDLEIEIPDAAPAEETPRIYKHLNLPPAPTTGPLCLSASGTIEDRGDCTEEQIRTYLVNELAREHLGKTVTINLWRLVPVACKESAR